jgi:Transposase and inactivated derivatives
VLVLEDLDVQGLIQKSENKKRRLRLYDSSFSDLRAVLEWQFRKRGKLVLPVPAFNTSRECFLCGGINQSLTLEDRVFHCPFCSFTLDRDFNASLVLLKRAGWVPPAVACFAPPSSLLRVGGEARWSDDSGSSRHLWRGSSLVTLSSVESSKRHKPNSVTLWSLPFFVTLCLFSEFSWCSLFGGVYLGVFATVLLFLQSSLSNSFTATLFTALEPVFALLLIRFCTQL